MVGSMVQLTNFCASLYANDILDPAICTAGVLLFTGFTFALEIPIGGVAWIVWARMTSWRRPAGRAPGGATAIAPS